jgi:hypothetical protein
VSAVQQKKLKLIAIVCKSFVLNLREVNGEFLSVERLPYACLPLSGTLNGSAVLLIVMKCNWLTIIIALYLFTLQFIQIYLLSYASKHAFEHEQGEKKCQFKRIFISFLFQFHRFRWKSSLSRLAFCCSTINSHFTTFFLLLLALYVENEAMREKRIESKRHTIEGRVYEIEIKMNDILKA